MELISISSAKANKHRPYLLILLWLIPVLAANIGLIFIRHIEKHWHTIEQRELARQELDSLSAGSKFSHQFARSAGEFRNALSSTAEGEMQQEDMASYLDQRSETIFREPFPQHHLFVFAKPENEAASSLLLARSSSAIRRRVLSQVFDYLVSLNKETDITPMFARQSETMLTQLLGSQSHGEIMARSQRGKPSFAYYGASSWFLWDYIETENGDIYGFMILTLNNKECDSAAMLLALRDLRDRQTGLGAFIPLFNGFGNTVLMEPLNQSVEFRQYINEHIYSAEADIGKLLARGPPPPTHLGDHIIFSHLSRESTHLATFVMPADTRPLVPTAMKVFNQIFMALLLMLVIRGILLDSWPRFNLKVQFAIIYLLAAALPVSILIFAAFGYIAQYRRAVQFQQQSQLELAIKRFDSSKAQILESYRSAFDAANKDTQLHDMLATEGMKNEHAIKRVKSFFQDRTPSLPLLGLAIFDVDGSSLRGYGDMPSDRADILLNAFRYPLVELLRTKVVSQRPDMQMPEFNAPDVEKLGSDAYLSVTGNLMADEFDKRRSQILVRTLGSRNVGQLHEIININGKARYMMTISWDDKALDGYSIRQTTDYFALNNPDFNFVTYRAEPQGLTYIQKPIRHVDADFLFNARHLANQASFRRSTVSTTSDGYALVAMPAQSYDQTIIVGGTSTEQLNDSIIIRLVILTLVLLLAVILVLIFSYTASQQLIIPITAMKDAVDQIASGNLKLEIISESSDEIGELSQEFSQMTIGLRERERLASLLSDQAIAALEKYSSKQSELSGESFEGVALVSDIRNFTTLCEKHEPDEIIKLLNQHFATMAQVINAHGGRIYKFIGDAIEAVFHESAEDEMESAAMRAFKAAAQMNVELIKINSRRKKSKLFEYRAGIGLTYGQLFSGSIGSSDTRMDFAILGDPLKRAARLESYSINNPAFPLVTDSTIAQALIAKGIVFAELEGTENAWILSELGNIELSTPTARQSSTRNSDTPQEPGSRRFTIGNRQILSQHATFFAGVALLVAIFAAIIWADSFRVNTLAEQERIEISGESRRLIEQINTERSYQIAFESLMGNIISHVQSNLPWERSVDEPKLLQKLISEKIGETSALKNKPLNISVFSFDHTKSQQGGIDGFSQQVMSVGWNDEETSILEALSVWKHHYQQDLPAEQVYGLWWPAVKSLVGDYNIASIVSYDSYGTASHAQKNGEHHLFFWRQIFVLEPGTIEKAFAKDDSAFKDITNFNYRIAGTIFASIPTSLAADSLELLVQGFSDRENKVALVNQSNEVIAAKDFPPQLKAELSFYDKPASTAELAVTSERISIQNQEWNAVVVRHRQIQNSKLKYALLLLLLAFFIYLWWFVATHSSFISRSLASRLWLSLLASAALPLATVLMVFSFFANEQYFTQMAQERKDLQRFVESLEHKEDYSSPLAWQMANRISYSDEFSEAVKRYASDPSENNKMEINHLLEEQFKKVTMIPAINLHFDFSQVVLLTADGTQYAYQNPNIRNDKASSEGDFAFTTLLNHINQFLMRTFRPEYARKQSDAEALRNEIALDTGLEIIKLVFGEDAFIKMANAVGIPVTVTIQNGSAGLLIHAPPQTSSPDMIIIWMILFRNYSAIRNIASNHQEKHTLFTTEEHACGKFSSYAYAYDDFNLVNAATRVRHSNLPISKKIKIGNRNFLLEASTSLNYSTIFILGLVPEAPVLRDIRQLWGRFFMVVLIIILLIIILALNVSSEILQPIQQLKIGMREISDKNYAFRIAHSRQDELGELCRAFDHMAKKLEEKHLMSSMLSKDAHSSSISSTQKSKNIEVTLLYIGIPSFDALMSLAGPESVFSDLRQQVALIARTILDAGGDIDKVIGDKILAVFRSNGNAEQATIEACRTAQQIARAESSGKIPFPVAIGINRGTVITGFLGAGQKRDYSIIGDTVNISARIESLAEQVRFNRCLVSETVFASAGSEFDFCEFGEVELKGKQKPVIVYQMIS